VLTSNALERPWERVQVNVGFTLQSADTNVSITPEMIRLVFDMSTGQALVNVSLPAEALGLSRFELMQAGVMNGLVEFDLLFDAEALYARAPILANVLPMALGSWDEPAEGDFSGWLKLGTVADFEALESMLSTMGGGMSTSTPDLSALEGLAPDELKEKLEASGVTLSYEGGGTRNGAEVDHLSLVLDYAKFASDPPFGGFETEMLDQLAARGLTMTTDMWFDRASGRIVEIVASGTSSSDERDLFEMTVTFSEPDPSISFDPPVVFVDVPLVELFSNFFGGIRAPFEDEWGFEDEW
jgi:hypothetical protein